MKTYKEFIHIDNSLIIFNVDWSSPEPTWWIKEPKNDEVIHIPLGITFSRIWGRPVFRLFFFKLLIELAIK
jgi:hypothetical protein